MGRRAKPTKGKAEAKRPLARKSPNDVGAKVRDFEQRLAESLQREKATSEILRVISRSQTDVQPVFDAIVQSAVRLLGAYSGALTRVDGDQIVLSALTSSNDDAADAALRAFFPHSVHSGATHAHAIRTRMPFNIADAQADPRVHETVRAYARSLGYYSQIVVPMLRRDEAIGAIAVTRREPGGFTDDEIALLQTFADQAVIAIENARLLTELHQKNAALTEAHARVSEALEQQTATGEILKVIAGSPTDSQPVFDAIVRNSQRLLRAAGAVAFRRIGDEIHLAALTIDGEAGKEALASGYPVPFSRMVSDNPVSTRAWVNGEVGNLADALADPRWPERLRGPVRAFKIHGLLIVPMRRDDVVFGVITVMRHEVGLFSNDDIDLLKTFADQAVIAIENVRLFTELQEKNRAVTAAHAQVTEALEQQSATSEILRVISSSPTDIQPVFDAIVARATNLCGALFSALFRFDGKLLHFVAHHNFPTEAVEAFARDFPARPEGMTTARAILERRVVNVADVLADPTQSPKALARAEALGYRSLLAVPMFREGQVIGTIAVARAQVGGFTNEQVELLKTFADQAVIAIENVRLFKELEARTQELTRSVDELTALGEVGRALSSTLNLETVLQTIVVRANELAGTTGCTIWEYVEPRAEFRLRASHYADQADAALLQAPGRVMTIPRGQGVTTRVMEQRQPVQIHDITTADAYESPIRRPLIEAGHRALLGVPLLSEDEVIGVLAVTRKTPGEFEPETVRLLSTFATQSALAIQNARLFLEIEDKSRQLEAASQHKSEFLANMSHELRTPLNAIIGFSEVLAEGMFGEVNEKQTEYLRDILESGRHLLSLINDILDLSKIEAGRMELEPTDFDLPGAIDNALTLVRERAGRRGITLAHEIDGRVGTIRADERKVKQVVLNLLSNAIKFTPEGGRIDVRAALSDGTVEVSVADTGVGIAPGDQEAVFEEFRQVGTADKKVEGTGLGLALSRKFIELHGGRIWVESVLGHGATFTFTLPVRRGE